MVPCEPLRVQHVMILCISKVSFILSLQLGSELGDIHHALYLLLLRGGGPYCLADEPACSSFSGVEGRWLLEEEEDIQP